MPNISEEEMKYYLENTLKLTDTFSFDCQMCGKCCRKREEPIAMTGLDIFRICKALDKQPWDVLTKYMKGVVGHTSHLPLVYLDERPDGSCKLLHKGRCIVQENKPIVCALFPLGRFKADGEFQFKYFLSQSHCIGTKTRNKEWTLQEWLDNFQIEEYEQESLAWHKLLMGIVKVTAKMPIDKITPHIIEAMFMALYLHYNINEDFVNQVKENHKTLDKIFRKTYGKSIM